MRGHYFSLSPGERAGVRANVIPFFAEKRETCGLICRIGFAIANEAGRFIEPAALPA